MSGNYVYETIVPANTLETNPLETEAILTPGIIDQISIGFPPGCRALTHLQIKHETTVIFPSNPNSSYAWDDIILTFFPKYSLEESNANLVLVHWNDDLFHQHQLTVIINVSPFPQMTAAVEGTLTMFGVI